MGQSFDNRSDSRGRSRIGLNSTLDRSTLHLLHRVAQVAEQSYVGHVGENGPTSRQLVVLSAIAANDGVSQTALVASTGIDRSTLADMAKRLQRLGLIKRKRSRSDARAYHVHLTDRGRGVLDHAAPAAAFADTQWLGGLSADQRQDFLHALDRIIRSHADAGFGVPEAD